MKGLPEIALNSNSINMLEGLKNRRDPEAIKAVAREMESLFAYEMIKAMRNTTDMGKDSFGKGAYINLFDMEIARIFAERGLGIKDILINSLNRQTRLDNQPQNDIAESKGSANDSEIDNCLPVKDGVITSRFGMRTHPIYGDNRFHYGIDIAAPEGTDVYPLRDGHVVYSGQDGGYGNVIIIDHGDGFLTLYAHNKLNLVKKGDYVDKNNVIAKVGSTGLSTGSHLHLEVRYNDRHIDPEVLLAKK